MADHAVSRHSYLVGRELLLEGPPFDALIQAAMRKADTNNLARLHVAFPEVGRELLLEDPPFDALIQAAMRKADTNNLARLRVAFPEIWEELQARYSAPGGYLPEEQVAP